MLVILLLLLLVILQYQLWMSDNGLIRTIKLRHAVNQQKNLNAELQGKNETLERDIVSLKQGVDVAEGIARHDLGMVKKGETFYRIVKKPEAKS